MAWSLVALGLVLFVALVLVHEWGHYLVARRNNIEVEEFGLGFPPRAKKLGYRKGTLFSLNWLPLGGFVKLKGEHDADTASGSFGAASFVAKAKVLLAGVGMNLLVAFLILTFLALIGLPTVFDQQFTVAGNQKILRQNVYIGQVQPDSPAAGAGLQVRDQLIQIQAGDQVRTIGTQDQLPLATKQFAGQQVTVTIKRNGQTLQKQLTLLTPQQTEQGKRGYLGISPSQYELRRYTWAAPVVALGLMKQITVATLQGLGHILSSLVHGHPSQATAQVAGPVGVFVLIKNGSFLGFQFILLIIAVISLTLAIMNSLPIPALDGGRLFIMAIFRVLRKPLTADREELINGIGFVALIGLFVIITIIDIKRNF